MKITDVTNYISDSILAGLAAGCVGYLCQKVVRYCDPKIGFVCGMTSAFMLALFRDQGFSSSSKIIAVASAILLPFEMCKRMELPATFKMTVVATATALAVSATAVGIALLIDAFNNAKNSDAADANDW